MQRSHLLAFVTGVPLVVGLVSALFFWWATTPPAISDPVPPPVTASVPAAARPATVEAPVVPVPTPAATPEIAASIPGQPMLNPVPTLDPTPVDTSAGAQAQADLAAGTHVPPARGLAGAPLPE